jgi:hypothetical protein
MSVNTAKLPWNAGVLKEQFLHYPAGTTVAFRLSVTKTPLAVGTVWLLKAQGEQGFHSVAESYGGVRLCSLVKWQIHSQTKKPVESSDATTAKLNKEYREFQLSLPPGARRMSRENSDKQRLKLRSLQNTVNI